MCRPVECRDDRLCLSRWGGRDHDGDVVDLTPSQCGRTRLHGLVGLTAQHRVDDDRLEPRVPRAAGLGRLCVHGRRAEGHLAAVAQHRLADLGALADRCQSLGLLLDDVDDRAEQVECLRQTDGAGQLARRRAEDVGCDVEPLVGGIEPGREAADPAVRDQGHPGTLVRGQRPEPLMGGGESGDRGRPQGTCLVPDRADRRARQAMAGGGHATSLFVCRAQSQRRRVSSRRWRGTTCRARRGS